MKSDGGEMKGQSGWISVEDKLPPEYHPHSDEAERGVVDYIAGMTDQYALRMAEELALLKGKVKQGEMF